MEFLFSLEVVFFLCPWVLKLFCGVIDPKNLQKTSLLRIGTHSTFDIQFQGVHGASETHSWILAEESLSLLTSSTHSRAEVGKLQAMNQIQLAACIAHKVLLEHSRAHSLMDGLCFHATRARLNSCHRDVSPAKPKIFTVWLFTEKSC